MRSRGDPGGSKRIEPGLRACHEVASITASSTSRRSGDRGWRLLHLTGRLREIVTELDPTLRLVTYPLTQIYRQETFALALVALLLALIGTSVLLLSAAGIYARVVHGLAAQARDRHPHRTRDGPRGAPGE